MRGFYPRLLKIERDKPIFAMHGVKDCDVCDLLEANLQTYYPKTFRCNKDVLMEREVLAELESGFTTVNLSQYYLNAVLDGDNLAIVHNAVADEMFSDLQYQMTTERTRRRNKVLSLDADDGVTEMASNIKSDDPVYLAEFMELRCRLCCLVNSLPEKQGIRVTMHFIDGKSRKEVAIQQGVSESSVNESIERGLKAMRKSFFEISEKLPCQMSHFCPDL